MKLLEEPHAFYRWSVKGKTPVIKTNRSHKGVSFYGGLSLKEKKEICVIVPWQNSQYTIEFLSAIKQRYNGKGTVLVIWDNVIFHKSKEVKAWLTNNPGVVELLNFPPYSPDLNPQEWVWKALRKHLSKVSHTLTFKQTVDAACRFLNTQKFQYDLPV